MLVQTNIIITIEIHVKEQIHLYVATKDTVNSETSASEMTRNY